jgi:hypothetical protein
VVLIFRAGGCDESNDRVAAVDGALVLREMQDVLGSFLESARALEPKGYF